MDNSEIPPPSTGISEVARKEGDDLENSQKPKPGSSSRPRRNRGKAENHKEGRKETTGISINEDPACKDLYLQILKDLESQHFIVQADINVKGSPFYCELCEMKLENIEECQNHATRKSHKKLKKSKGEHLALSRVSLPSEPQILALNRLLESVVLERGLCPISDLPRRQEVAKDVSKTVCSTHPECSVSVYGSSLTGFGLKESDINLDLVIPDEVMIPPVLLSILELLQNDEHYCDVKSEFDAKVPRILFKHVSSGLDCELSPGNVTASNTSRLLKMYADLDPRVRTLVVGLRHWARLCSVDCQSEGGLPGYSLALMVIHFLQEVKPPVLPRWNPTEMVEKPCPKEDFITENADEIGSLWFKLFRFFCLDFDIPNLVINIREPEPLKREGKNWGRRRIAVEDPFSTKRNVASSMSSDKAFEYFFACWKNSYFYFGSLPGSSQNNPVADSPNTSSSNSNKKSDKMKQKTDVLIKEEAIFEMDDVDNATNQLESLKLQSSDNGVKPKGVQSEKPTEEDSPNVKSKTDDSVSDEEVEITLSESDNGEASESKIKSAEDNEGHVDSENRGSLNTESVNKTAVVDVPPDIEFRFDAQVFRGKSRPVTTCCFCKEDGHIKTQCPDLRKPPLRPLPPMTQQFGDVLDFACRTCRNDFEFDKSEVGYREKVLRNLEVYIHEIFPGARLFLFGSSKNGFGFRTSDIDICMTLDNMAKEEVDAVEVIKKLAKLLKKHKDCANVLAITTAKVPIVKFYLRSCKREADISLYNTLALENTAMLATYAKLDDRVATLGYTVKVFAKVCDIGDASKGSLSSYAYILMLLHYLQQCNPPVIPVLQNLYTENKKPEKIIDGWNCWFCKDPKEIKNLWNQKQANPYSAGMLWYGFLRYYTEQFDFEHDVVCCRRTKKLTKFEKMWTKHVFAIEDPFNLDHNLGAGVTRKMASYIMSTFIRGRERFGFPRYDIPPQLCQRFFFDVYFLTDGYEAPTDRNCRVCGKIGHIAKDCPRSKSNRRAEEKKEEEERKVAKENGQIPVISRKPFNAGPARPRSASTPNKQEQKRENEISTSLPVSRQNNISAPQEVSGQSSSRSQPDTNSVTAAVTQNHEVNLNENSIANSPGMPPSHVQSPQTGVVNKNGSVTDLESETMVANSTHAQTPSPKDLSANVATDIIPGSPTQGPHATGAGSNNGLAERMSPQVSKSPPEIPDGQPLIMNTPPRSQPFMFPPQTGHLLGSPSQYEMWRRHHELMALTQSFSPPIRPLVPYPLSPEAQTQGQHWNVVSENLPMQHFGSPIRGQQHRAVPNEHLVSHSPPNISRNVMWPAGIHSPPHAARGHQYQEQQLPFPRVGAPGLPVPVTGSPPHPRLSYASSPGVPVSPQQIAQHLQITNSPGMSPPVYGSPPQHALQHSVPRQEGLSHPLMGTHMTGEQFMDLMRKAEDESKKQESALATKVSSNEVEHKELKTVAPKDLKIAETPEEHKLLSKLNQVKSLWEEGFSLAPERTCPNPEPTVNGHLQEQSGVGLSAGEMQLPAKREAWGPVPDTHEESDEIKLVDADQKEKDSVPSDGKMQATSSPSDETSEETNVKHQTTGTTPEELPTRKPTRRGGRGRKPKGSRYIERDTNAVQKLEEKFLEDEQIATKGNRQSGHAEQKYGDIAVGTSPQKERSAVKSKEQKIVEGSSESGTQHKKKSPSSAKERDKGQPEITHQEARTAERHNAPRNSTEGLKGAVPKKKNASNAQDEQKKGQQRSRKGKRTRDSGNPHDSAGEEVEDGAFKRKSAQSSGRNGVKKGSGGSSQDARRAVPEDSTGNPSKEITDATSCQKDSLTSAKGGGKVGSEVSSQAVQSADSRNPHGYSIKNGGDGASNRKGPPTSPKNGGKREPEGSSQGARPKDSSDSLEGPHKLKGGKGGSPKQKGPPTSTKNGDKKGLEGSSQDSRKADSADSPGSPIKGDTGGSANQRDFSTSTNGRENKGSERGSESIRTADSGDSPGSVSKGAKGGSPNQKRSPSNTNDRQKKGPEPAENFGNFSRDSSKGGRGGARNRRRRRQHSRANSEGNGGEKRDPRSRSNSEPDRHRFKNS